MLLGELLARRLEDLHRRRRRALGQHRELLLHVHALRALTQRPRPEERAQVVARGVEVRVVEAGAGLEDEGAGVADFVVGGVVGAACGGDADIDERDVDAPGTPDAPGIYSSCIVPLGLVGQCTTTTRTEPSRKSGAN